MHIRLACNAIAFDLWCGRVALGYSAGIAEVLDGRDTIDAMLRRADSLLYSVACRFPLPSFVVQVHQLI